MIDRYGQRAWRILTLTAPLVAFILFLLPSPLVKAASITVTTTTDELNTNGQCSLREAITNANTNSQSGSPDCTAGTGDDTITFDLTGTVTLGSTLMIQDTAGLTITGPGDGINLNGGDSVRVFQMSSGTTLTLENLTVADGRGGGAGGGGLTAYSVPVTLTIRTCTFQNNTAQYGGGINVNHSGSNLTVINSTFSGNIGDSAGGGIFNRGTLTIENSTFVGNYAVDGGGIQNDGSGASTIITGSTFFDNNSIVGGGAENNGGLLTITNSTFSGNSSYTICGGIYNGGTLTVTNSTVSGNTTGLCNAAGTTTLRNTIVSSSTAGGNCSGSITNGGNNIDSGTTCGWDSIDGSLSNTDPQTGPLSDNGGPTLTFSLLAGSPAIDGVTYNPPNNCPTTDQRGYIRPIDGNDDGDVVCDIGALEYGSPSSLLIYIPLVSKNP